MKHFFMKNLSIALLFFSFSNFANAGLIPIPGGQAVYDDVLDITWLTDANIAASETFGVSGILTGGGMHWDTALEWIDAMNAAVYLGFSNWRLPHMDVNGDGTVIECSFGGIAGCSDNEMGHLYWESGITAASPGTFSGLQSNQHWSDLEGTDFANTAWAINFGSGNNNSGVSFQNNNFFTLVVHDGNLSQVPVPLPAAVWLLGSVLLGLAGFGKKKLINR